MKKQDIELIDGGFRLNGEPFFIYSGEIHYFRIPRKEWKGRLSKAKKAGLNTVASYIPWRWHEPQEGFFDFTGRIKPEKDIIGFINLLEKMGLYFVARPGPVCHGEIIMDGLPTWLVERYPQIRIKKRDGSFFPYPSLPSFMNPIYQDYVSKWYRAILPILKVHQVNQGRCIIALQLDNEIGMVNWLNKVADYSQTTTRLYQEYLREKYGHIEKLNKPYGSQYRRFEDVLQPDNEVNKKEMMRYWDWSFFYRRFYALYYQSLVKRVQAEGIQIPLIANIPQFYDYDTSGRGIQGLMTTSLFRDFSSFVPEVIFGGAYQMRRLNFENFHDIGLVTETVKMITKPGIPSFCAELQVGIMNDRPRIYPADVELNIKTSTGHGLSGLNGYLFCGGVNPKDIGLRGSYHEWQAPISSKGKEMPHLEPIKLFGRFLKSFGKYLALTKKQYDLVLGLYFPYYATEYLSGSFIENLTRKRDRLFFDGVARLLQMAGINFSLLDLQRGSQEELAQIPCLWAFTLDFMDLTTQKKLANYVKDGGNLVLNPLLPNKDLNLKSETFLIDNLGLRVLKYSPSNMILRDGLEYLAGAEEMSIFDSRGCRVITKTPDGEACTILKKAGKGQVLVIGFGMTHIFDYQVEIVKEYAHLMGIKPKVLVEPFDVHCVLRKNEEFGFLFLGNYHDEPREAFVELVLPGERKKTRIPSKGRIVLPNRRLWILPVGIPLNNKIRIKYSTAEILGYRILRDKLFLVFHGARDARVEILLEIKRPKEISLNKTPVYFKYQNGLCKIEVMANGEIEELLIEV